jgi:hypothetical protein
MKLSDIIDYAFDKVFGGRRIKVISSILISCVLATILFIYFPRIFGNTYILLENRFLFSINKNFSKCTIYLIDPININSIIINPDFKAREIRALSETVVNSKEKTITILPPKKDILKDVNYSNLAIEIFYSPFDQVKIEKIDVDNTELKLEDFYENYLRVKSKIFIDKWFLRDHLSGIINALNDTVSNWAMTFFAIFSIFLILNLLYLSYNYLKTEIKFEKFLYKLSGFTLKSKEVEEVQKLKIMFGENHYKKDMWFRFLQAFGPAFGFLFTITSLIAGLNPKLQMGRDISQFFSAIQVAMTSTFIGLIVRIVAMGLQLVNNKIFDRAEDFFQNLENNSEN